MNPNWKDGWLKFKLQIEAEGYNVSNVMCKIDVSALHDIVHTFAVGKAGESQGRAPGQSSDCALRAPSPLDSRTHN